MEPGRDGDEVVTSRKGVGRFVMTVKGRASHAGVRHEDGRSAILEMAKQILRIEGKTDYARGITCNVGLVKGGTGVNVVSAECTAEIDLRVAGRSPADPQRLRQADRRAGLSLRRGRRSLAPSDRG
jgi:glutamate carboxypeptidase